MISKVSPNEELQPVIKNSSNKETFFNGRLISKVDKRPICDMPFRVVDVFKQVIAENLSTDSKGNFSFPFNGYNDQMELTFEVLAPRCGIFGLEEKQRVLDTFKINPAKSFLAKIGNFISNIFRYIFCFCCIPSKNSRTNSITFDTPFEVKVLESIEPTSISPLRYVLQDPPKPNNVDFNINIATGAFPVIVEDIFLKIKSLFTNIDTHDIEEAFGEKTRPQHTPETLIQLILGFYDPHEFLKHETDKDKFYLDIKTPYEKKKDAKGFPEHLVIEICNIKDKDGKIIGLDVTKIITNYSTDPKLAQSFYPDDVEEFAKQIAKACDVIFTRSQAETHLGRGHLFTGWVAYLLIRNILNPNNPLHAYYTEFLKSVQRINFLGKTQIFDVIDGVFKITDFTQPGINQLLRDAFDKITEHYTPRKPLYEGDLLGRIKNLVFDIIMKNNDICLDKMRDEITKNFTYEIVNLSKDMERTSFTHPEIPIEKIKNVVDASELIGKTSLEDNKQNSKENISKKDVPSFQPIMKNDGKLDDEAWERLKTLIGLGIYWSVIHGFYHERQKFFALYPSIYSLATRNLEKGKKDTEGVSNKNAETQIVFAAILLNIRENVEKLIEDMKVPKEIRDAFIANKDEFIKLFVEIAEISVGTTV